MIKQNKKALYKPDNDQGITLAIVQQMTKLATSGFSLVAALAWNNVIQETVNNYIKPYISKDSGIVSLFLYAILITMLAVAVTLKLTRVEQKLTEFNRIVKNKVHQAKSNKSTQYFLQSLRNLLQ